MVLQQNFLRDGRLKQNYITIVGHPSDTTILAMQLTGTAGIFLQLNYAISMCIYYVRQKPVTLWPQPSITERQSSSPKHSSHSQQPVTAVDYVLQRR